MRTHILLLGLGLMTTATAQHDATVNGGAGGFTGGVTFLDGATYPLLGGRGGFLIDRRFIIGGGGASGWGTVDMEQGADASLGFGYGGLLLGWWPMPDARVRPMVNILLGGGGYERLQPVEGDLYHVVDRGGFLFDGEAGVLIRLHEHIRLSITAGWRSVGTGDDLLNTPSAVAGIWFGQF